MDRVARRVGRKSPGGILRASRSRAPAPGAGIAAIDCEAGGRERSCSLFVPVVHLRKGGAAGCGRRDAGSRIMPWELLAAALAVLSACAAAAGLLDPATDAAPLRRFSGAALPGSAHGPGGPPAWRRHVRWTFLSMLLSAMAAAIVFALAVTRVAGG